MIFVFICIYFEISIITSIFDNSCIYSISNDKELELKLKYTYYDKNQSINDIIVLWQNFFDLNRKNLNNDSHENNYSIFELVDILSSNYKKNYYNNEININEFETKLMKNIIAIKSNKIIGSTIRANSSKFVIYYCINKNSMQIYYYHFDTENNCDYWLSVDVTLKGINMNVALYKSTIIQPYTQIDNFRLKSTIYVSLSDLLTLKTEQATNLKVTFVLKHDYTFLNNEIVHCVHLKDDKFHKEGCYLLEITTKSIKCECNHNSSYAILLGVSTIKAMDASVAQISSITSSITIIFMIILIVYKISNSFNGLKNSYIIISLCISIILLHLSFILSNFMNLFSDWCSIMSLITQIMFNIMFSTKLLLAIFYTVKVCSIFNSFDLKLLIAFQFALYILVTVPSIVLFYQFPPQKPYRSCFAYGVRLYFGNLVVVMLITSMNLILVIYSLIIVSKISNIESTRKRMNKLKFVFILSIMYGIPWLFGFVVIGYKNIVIEWIFVAIIFLQGPILLYNQMLSKYFKEIYTKINNSISNITNKTHQ